MEIKIREIKEEDIPQLHRNVNDPEVCKYLMVSYPVPYEDSVKHWQERMANPNIFVLVAELNGVIVGMTDMIRQTRKPIKHNAEMAIVVARDRWGKDIGTLLVEAMKQKARNLGITRLALGLQKEHQVALSLYQKCGFKVCGERTHYIKDEDGYHDFIDMELLL